MEQKPFSMKRKSGRRGEGSKWGPYVDCTKVPANDFADFDEDDDVSNAGVE